MEITITYSTLKSQLPGMKQNKQVEAICKVHVQYTKWYSHINLISATINN